MQTELWDTSQDQISANSSTPLPLSNPLFPQETACGKQPHPHSFPPSLPDSIPSLSNKRAAPEGVPSVNFSLEIFWWILIDLVSLDSPMDLISKPLDGGSIYTGFSLACKLRFLSPRAVSAWKNHTLLLTPISFMALLNPPPPANQPNRENNPVRLTAVPNANLIRALSLTLAGKLLANQHPNFEQLHFQSARAFDCVGRISVNDHGRKLYSFEFLSQADVERVLNGGPWFVAGGLLLVERMKPRTPIEVIKFFTTKLWIRIHDLSPMGFTHEFSRGVGDALGRTCEVELPGDDARFHRIPNIRRYLRTKVELNINRPIQRFQRLELEDENGDLVTYTLRLSYERLPEVCYYCGVLSHHHDDCSLYDGVAPLLYGDWIRADRFFRLAPPIDDYVPWPELLIPDQLEQEDNHNLHNRQRRMGPIPNGHVDQVNQQDRGLNLRRRMDPIPNGPVDQVNQQDRRPNLSGQQGSGPSQPPTQPAVTQPAQTIIEPPAAGHVEQSQPEIDPALYQAHQRISELQAFLQAGQPGATPQGFLPFQAPSDCGWIQPSPFSAPAHLFPGLRPPRPPIASNNNVNDVLWYGGGLGMASQAWYSPYHQQHPAFALDRLYSTPTNQKNFNTNGIQPPSFSPFPSSVPAVRILEIDSSATTASQTTDNELQAAAVKAASLLAGSGEIGEGSNKGTAGEKRKAKSTAPSSRKSARGKEKMGEPSKVLNATHPNDDGGASGGSDSNIAPI